MNERIQELVEEANLSADKTYQFDPKDGFQIQEWDKFRLEKFAELIVKECMRVGRTSQINNGLVDTDIKEHFGLE